MTGNWIRRNLALVLVAVFGLASCATASTTTTLDPGVSVDPDNETVVTQESDSQAAHESTTGPDGEDNAGPSSTPKLDEGEALGAFTPQGDYVAIVLELPPDARNEDVRLASQAMRNRLLGVYPQIVVSFDRDQDRLITYVEHVDLGSLDTLMLSEVVESPSFSMRQVTAILDRESAADWAALGIDPRDPETGMSTIDEPLAPVIFPGSDGSVYQLEPAALTIRQVTEAFVGTQNDQWLVNISLDGTGGRVFQELTASMFGLPSDDPARTIAIVVARVVESAPVLALTVGPEGLAGGKLQILVPDEEEADRLVEAIVGGALEMTISSIEVVDLP